MRVEVSICRTCKATGHTLNAFGECVKCVKQRREDVREALEKPSDKKQLEQIRTDLLAWAGLHRGKAISEEAMPRFHEIIDRLDAIRREL